MPRGKKTCPDCNTELGVRTHNCPECQYDFSSAKKEKYSTEKKKKEEKKNGNDNGNGNGKTEKVSPVVAELLAHVEENPYVEPKEMDRDDHADRVLSYGENRAKNLLHLSGKGGWGHVNWQRVEEGIGV